MADESAPRKKLVDMSNEELLLYSMSICLMFFATALQQGPGATPKSREQGAYVHAAALECRNRVR